MSIVLDPVKEFSTLRDLIGANREELARAVEKSKLLTASNDEAKGLATVVSRVGRESFSLQVADHLGSDLATDPVEIFAGAWAKFSELKNCAQQTVDNPGSTGDVALAEHEFSYDLKTTLDIVFDGVNIASVPFAFELSCAVSGLELFLKKGSVYEVRSGEANLRAVIQCAGEEIWSRPIRNVHLSGVLHLKKPLQIVS